MNPPQGQRGSGGDRLAHRGGVGAKQYAWSGFGGNEGDDFFYVLGFRDDEQLIAHGDDLLAARDGELLGLLVVDGNDCAFVRETRTLGNGFDLLA